MSGLIHNNKIEWKKYVSWSEIKEHSLRYFELLWPSTKLPLNWGKPENKTLQKYKNTKEILIKHKGTRMVKDAGDWQGLKLKSLA